MSLLASIKRIFLLLTVNALVLVAALIPVELYFGGWIYPARLNKLNLIRNVRLVHRNTLYDNGVQEVVYTRDRYGLRGNFRNPSQISILTVGGSTTDQRYITDGSTWQDVLERELQQNGKDVRVANAGVDGQSTVGHLKAFTWWFPQIPELHPKLVLFYVGVNDLWRRPTSYDELVNGNASDTEPSWSEVIVERSALVHLWTTLVGMYRANTLAMGHQRIDLENENYTRTPLRHDYDTVLGDTLAAYRGRLEALVKETAKLGSRPVFVTQPTYFYRASEAGIEGCSQICINKIHQFQDLGINGVDYYNMLRQLDAVTLDVCAKANGICIDLNTVKGWERSDFYDWVHMTPAGAHKVGLRMAAALEGEL